jgi:hypothetical protein
VPSLPVSIGDQFYLLASIGFMLLLCVLSI